MRTISFVERLELEFHEQGGKPWSLCQEAIALGDVDNDGCNELAVGPISGYLLIYKGKEQRPWRSSKCLGEIACVAIGKICAKDGNDILVLSAEGWCHIFHIPAVTSDVANPEVSSRELNWIHRQHLYANSKVLMLADIDGDGKMEIVVGFSDRVVRSYRWFEQADGKGEIVLLQKWSLSGQIGSISMNSQTGLVPEVMVSQPGGTYVSLLNGGQVQYHALPSRSPVKNANVFTEIVGNVSSSQTQGGSQICHALSTLDGYIMLLNNEGETIFDIQVDRQLFGLTKLDVTGDGIEEVIACSWDGQTYIVNSNKQIAKFQFDEQTSVFVAGHYSVGSDQNEPCLIYVTFDGRIYIYHNIKLAQVQTYSLIEALSESEEVKQFMDLVGMRGCSREEKKKLYQWCLYGQRPSPTL